MTTNPIADEVDDDPRDISKWRPWKGKKSESIALVAQAQNNGVVLDRQGQGIDCFIDETGSSMLADLGLDDAPEGLSIWEGKIVPTRSFESRFDDDAVPSGAFRPLTPDEWVRLAATGVPWEIEGEPPLNEYYETPRHVAETVAAVVGGVELEPCTIAFTAPVKSTIDIKMPGNVGYTPDGQQLMGLVVPPPKDNDR